MSSERGDDYPGQRFGLPEGGTGSTAPWGRRALALFVDWFASLGVTALISPQLELSETATRLTPLLVLFVELTLLVGLLGSSLGHRVLGIRVARLDGRPVGVPRAGLRSALICLVIPAVVFDKDRRGLHDLAVGTVVIAT
ncbi:RDD family protein [soil metagenome]